MTSLTPAMLKAGGWTVDTLHVAVVAESRRCVGEELRPGLILDCRFRAMDGFEVLRHAGVSVGQDLAVVDS